MSRRGRCHALAGTVDVPAAVHAHVRAQHQAAGEAHQQVLAGRVDALDRPAGERRVVVDPGERGEHRLEADDRLAGQRAVQRARGAEDGVAFRHALAGISVNSPTSNSQLPPASLRPIASDSRSCTSRLVSRRVERLDRLRDRRLGARRRARRIMKPIADGLKPASTRNGASGCSAVGTPLISAISSAAVSRQRQPSRAGDRAADRERAGSSSGRNT